MDKKELMTKVLRKAQNYQQLLAGVHDLAIDATATSGMLHLTVSLYPRDEKNELCKDENGKLILMQWGYYESLDSEEELENTLKDMCDTLNKYAA